ncbi:MAG: O-methyltransferase [bacterium]|nr:O-methyltransferase [bacterium]
MERTILSPELTEYLFDLENLRSRSAWLKHIEKRAVAEEFPIIGPLVGRLLATLARAVQAKRILELGSGFGYSALWFSKGMESGGVIVCTDGDARNRDCAFEYFSQAQLSQRIDFRVGDALATARELSGPFDIVFNDIDKHEYPSVIEEAHRLLRSGGLLISDNTLWSGRVFDPEVKDRNTKGIKQYNEMLFADLRFFSTIVPLRDGVSVSVKL